MVSTTGWTSARAAAALLAATAMAAALHGSNSAEPGDVRAAAAALVRAGCRNVLVTRGEHGVLWARAAAAGDGGAGGGGVAAVEFEEHAALPVTSIVSTRGAGDSFVAAAAFHPHQKLRGRGCAKGRQPSHSLREAVPTVASG